MHPWRSHSRLQLTDVLQQRLRCAFLLSLHAPSEVHEQGVRPVQPAARAGRSPADWF
jgi:hypothetical protein